jgi:ribosomal protein S18 acetylase RimI-like enzyme
MKRSAADEYGIGLNFRPLRNTDYPELRRMIHALYYEDPVDKRISAKKVSRTVRELRRNPCKGEIIIFEKDNVAIGYSILIFYWSNEYGGDILNIDELYVKPEQRERGVATSFLKHISRTFKDKIVAVQLEVSPSNTRALDFYRKLGFKKTRNMHLRRTK